MTIEVIVAQDADIDVSPEPDDDVVVTLDDSLEVIQVPEQGPPGPMGAPGTPGTDGNTILYGVGIPSPALGKNGDLYLDTSTNIIYGPKSGGAWPAGTSLVGPTGAALAYVQDNPPTGIPDNTLWWETDTGLLYVYYNDGTSKQWVIACPQPDISTFVQKAGDTLTGPLIAAADPTAALGVATKQYADQKVAKGGDTMTGLLTLSGNPSTNLQAATKQYVDAAANVITRGYLSGLGLSTAGSSATFTVQPGLTCDAAFSNMMTLASALNKTTSAWAVGSGNGSLDTGSIAASTWYHVYLIKRLDTGVVDVLISLNATTPTTLPTNYTVYRRIGSIFTNGSSQWYAFTQIGDDFYWNAPFSNFNNFTTLANGNQALAVTVPPGLTIEAYLSGAYSHATPGNTLTLSEGFLAASPNTAPGVATFYAAVTNQLQFVTLRCFTNTTQQILAATSAAGGNFYLATRGWRDRRGRDA